MRGNTIGPDYIRFLSGCETFVQKALRGEMPQFRVNFDESTRNSRERPLSSLVVKEDMRSTDSREIAGGNVRRRDEEQVAVAQLAYHTQLRRAKENGRVPICMIGEKSSPPIFTFISATDTFENVSEVKKKRIMETLM